MASKSSQLLGMRQIAVTTSHFYRSLYHSCFLLFMYSTITREKGKHPIFLYEFCHAWTAERKSDIQNDKSDS
jgi:hypothetical protein